MMATSIGTPWLILELPEPEALDATAAVAWLRIDRDGAVDSGRAPLAERAAQPGKDTRATRKVMALIPGERAPLHRARVPGRSARVRRRALPYTLEERFSEDLEDLRVVPGPMAGEHMCAAVAARRDLQAWETWLREYGLDGIPLVPDTALIRDLGSAQGHFVLAGRQRCLVLAAETEPVALPRSLADWWLQARELPPVPDTAETGSGTGCVAGSATPDAEPPACPESLHPPDDWSGSTVELLAYALRSGHLPPGDATRLLQAARPFNLATPRNNTGPGLLPGREWRLPAGMAAALALAWLATAWAETHQLQQQNAALEGEMAEVFAEALPEQRMVDPVGQFEVLLRGADESPAATHASAIGERLALAIEHLDAPDLTLQRIRGDRRRLELELDSPAIADVESLRERLQEAGDDRVRIASADAHDDGVRARLTLEER